MFCKQFLRAGDSISMAKRSTQTGKLLQEKDGLCVAGPDQDRAEIKDPGNKQDTGCIIARTGGFTLVTSLSQVPSLHYACHGELAYNAHRFRNR